MKPHEIGQVLGLATRLKSDYPASIRSIAGMLIQMEEAYDPENLTAETRKTLARIGGRIYDLMPGVDEPKFSLHDYADAIANAQRNIDPSKMLNLDDESFIAAMLWLAEDKRESYEERDHVQEPLEIDVYADAGKEA